MSLRRPALLLAAPLVAAALSGCISVLPKSKPDQLYTFGLGVSATAPTPAPPAKGGPTLPVLLSQVELPRAAQGDSILTLTGDQAAYIAQSRWTAPAAVLFREAVQRAFDRQAQRTRLVARGEIGRLALVLRVDVLDFETLYPNGAGSTPTVAVSVKGRLTGPDGVAIEDKSFDVRRPASDNRVGPIVEAYNAATAEALSGLVTWTDQVAMRAPPTASATAAAAARPAAVTRPSPTAAPTAPARPPQ